MVTDLGFDSVSRIALVSPQRSQQIEGILLRMAQSGQLRGRITENQLIELLEQVGNTRQNFPWVWDSQKPSRWRKPREGRHRRSPPLWYAQSHHEPIIHWLGWFFSNDCSIKGGKILTTTLTFKFGCAISSPFLTKAACLMFLYATNGLVFTEANLSYRYTY